MTEHAAKAHPIAGFIMLLIISVLASWGFGLMGSGTIATGAPAGVALFLVGTYALLALAPGDDA